MRRISSARPLAPRRAASASTAVASTPPAIDRERRGAERAVLDELAAWRARAVPDASTPLEVEDLAALLADCFASLGLDRAVTADFTVNTVHYYRRKDIIDPPEGRTAAARWSIRHLWQIAGARLAGHLGLVTLAQARDVIRDADVDTLLGFLAARVVDARARQTMRNGSRPSASTGVDARPLSARASRGATMLHLPHDVLCIVPASHPAHRSADAARDLGRALTNALLRSRT